MENQNIEIIKRAATIRRVEKLLHHWYSLNAGIAFSWADGEPPWACVVFANEKEEIERIKSAMSILPKQIREVLRLLYFEQISPDDAAQVLGVSKMRLSNLRYMGLLRLCELGVWK